MKYVVKIINNVPVELKAGEKTLSTSFHPDCAPSFISIGQHTCLKLLWDDGTENTFLITSNQMVVIEAVL